MAPSTGIRSCLLCYSIVQNWQVSFYIVYLWEAWFLVSLLVSVNSLVKSFQFGNFPKKSFQKVWGTQQHYTYRLCNEQSFEVGGFMLMHTYYKAACFIGLALAWYSADPWCNSIVYTYIHQYMQHSRVAQVHTIHRTWYQLPSRPPSQIALVPVDIQVSFMHSFAIAIFLEKCFFILTALFMGWTVQSY